jgi:hypothetical protein
MKLEIGLRGFPGLGRRRKTVAPISPPTVLPLPRYLALLNLTPS